MLDSLKSFVDTKSSVSLLQHVRICDGRIVATNLERWADISAPWAKDIPPCCIPYEQLAAFLKRADGYDISYTILKDRITFRAGRMNVTVPTLSADEFPNLEHVDDGYQAKLATSDLRGIEHAMSSEQSRYFLRGVSLRNGLIEATDGHRLTRRAVDYSGPPIIVPDSFVNYLVKYAKDAISLTVREATATWRGPDIVATTKLIDGTFPDTDRLWPTDLTNSFTIGREDLAAALDAVSIVSSAVKIEITGGEAVFLGSDNLSESQYITECQASRDIGVGFQVKYLQQVIEAHPEADDIVVEYTDSGSVYIFNGDEVVMPFRT